MRVVMSARLVINMVPEMLVKSKKKLIHQNTRFSHPWMDVLWTGCVCTPDTGYQC